MSAGSNPARRPSLAMLSNRDSSGDPLATTRWFIWYIPVYRDARPGAQGAAWLNWETKRTPSRQSRSRCGVWTTGWPAADRQSALNWSRVTKSTFTALTLAARMTGGHRAVPGPARVAGHRSGRRRRPPSGVTPSQRRAIRLGSRPGGECQLGQAWRGHDEHATLFAESAPEIGADRAPSVHLSSCSSTRPEVSEAPRRGSSVESGSVGDGAEPGTGQGPCLRNGVRVIVNSSFVDPKPTTRRLTRSG